MVPTGTRALWNRPTINVILPCHVPDSNPTYQHDELACPRPNMTALGLIEKLSMRDSTPLPHCRGRKLLLVRDDGIFNP